MERNAGRCVDSGRMAGMGMINRLFISIAHGEKGRRVCIFCAMWGVCVGGDK